MVTLKNPPYLKKSSKDLGISKRMSLIRTHFSLSADALGEKAGISGTAIGNIERGDSLNPGAEMLSSISTMLGVNLNWLLLGEGEMLKSDTAPKNNSLPSAPVAENEAQEKPPLRAQVGGQLQVLTVQVGPDGEENIEVVDVRAAASYASQRIDREYIRKLPSFRLPGQAFNNGSYRCFQVDGDSMQTTLHDSDWLICRAVENWARDIRDNRVYVVVTETDVMVKRVINQFNERGLITLQSDNRSFSNFPVDGADVREVWEGVARLTRQLVNPRFDIPDELARQRAMLDEMFFRIEALENR